MNYKQFHELFGRALDFLEIDPIKTIEILKRKHAEVKTTTRKRAAFEATQQEIEIIEYLNLKAKRNYQPGKANVSFIRERIEEGATYEQLRQVIALKVAEWSCDDKMKIYMRPATLFNRTNFAQYQGEIPTKVQLKAVRVRKCNYPDCDDPTHGPRFDRCFLHMAEEFKESVNE